MAFKDFIGIDPETPRIPFAHSGEPGSDPEIRTLTTEQGALYIDLDPRNNPMRATLTDEEGATHTTTQGLPALLAYCTRWNADTQLMDICAADGTPQPHEVLFEAYHAHCLRQYRDRYRSRYQSFQAVGRADKVTELDAEYLAEHVANEQTYKQQTAEIDNLLFNGQLAPLMDEYLTWLQTPADSKRGKNQQKPPDEAGDWLKPYEGKLNICVTKGWIIPDGNKYRKAEGDAYLELAAILGMIFCGDKYNARTGVLTKGKKRLPSKQLQELFGVKRLSETVRKARESDKDFSVYYKDLS